MTWTAQNIRKQFLEFFKEKEHEIVASAPMVVKNDPTLMFTNAGMNQFKDVFLGYSDPASKRVSDTQKCLRVSGKHNDLEEVGVDTYHHTMFEMLGNWSFGDYFKKETISWAWELLTEIYKIDKDRIYITVFSGDEADKLGEDSEARKIWEQFTTADRVLGFDKKDNFWEMGETGPCGPCSEIHVDLRPEADRKAVDGRTLVNADHPQVVEIWNLVFISFNRKADKSLEPLPQKHIDTGMGFERLAMVLQGKQSNYDTDVFGPLLDKIQQLSGRTYGKNEQDDIAMRVIADHIRAIAFAIADGQLPSNVKAGYVIRRILRRAVRYAFSFLDLKEPFLFELVAILVREMGEAFPELVKEQGLITNVIREEEVSFQRTLENGITLINELLEKTKGDTISGEDVFILYDRYGFPEDLTGLILREAGKGYDKKAFDEFLAQRKADSRKDAAKETGDWTWVAETDQTEFLGYDALEATVQIGRYRKVTAKGKDLYQVVLDQTPFYPEGGGQIGDSGLLTADGEKWPVIDTRKENNLIIHVMPKLPENLNATFEASVNARKRQQTEKNHSATHLLHQALREVLGTHVEQKGSLVHPDYLRFDFSHFSKMTEEEIREVERLVNERVRTNFPLDERRDFPIDEAKAMGAMALFGEKYGDRVRVVRFGDSVELCGGTHVPATGSIGYVKIVSEGSIQAGIRRIEAISDAKAEDFLESRFEEWKTAKALLKNPKSLTQAIEDLMARNQEMTKELERLNRERAKAIKQSMVQEAVEVNGVRFISRQVDLDADMIKNLAFQVKADEENLMMVLGAINKGKASLTIALTEDLVKEKGLNAGQMIRELAREIGGGGGGQPFFATAGGKKPEGIPTALQKAEAFLQ